MVERFAEIVAKRGIPMPQIAFAWLLQKLPVTAPVDGTTELSHFKDAVAAQYDQLDVDPVLHG